jgi:hypothetical protein
MSDKAMNGKTKILQNKLLKFCTIVPAITAVFELAMSQFYIRMTRLAETEITGISLFAFAIFGLVTIFSVTRIKDSFSGKIFAFFMNIISSLLAAWYIMLLFKDNIFFRNLYYVLDKQTRIYELLSVSGRISASLPLAGIIAGAALYFFSGIAILVCIIIQVKEGNWRERPAQ